MIASRVKLALALSSFARFAFFAANSEIASLFRRSKMNINMKGTKRVVCFGVKVGGLNVLKS